MRNPFTPQKQGDASKKKPVWAIIICVEVVFLIVLLVACQQLKQLASKENTATPEITTTPTVATEPTVVQEEPEPTEETEPTETTEPVETEPQILSYLADMAAANSDMVGWIKIDDTKLNYPLMYTPDDEEKYIHKDFEGNYSIVGLPFIETNCTLEPRTDNLIIYGHNMANGKGFATLMDYAKESFWEEHPVVYLSTLYEETAYEVVAAFYDRVYYKHEDAFRFYQFYDAKDEEHFNYAIKQFKSKACYDTGITPQYGDHLITLVTCSYHTDNGRFVVVARAAANNNETQASVDNP